MKNLPITDFHGFGRHVPAPAGECDQQLSRCRGAAAHGRHGGRSGAAAGGQSVVRHQARISQYHLDSIQRHTQFLGRRLAQLTACALPHLDLATQHGDHAILAHVNARRDARFTAGARASAPLRRRGTCPDGDQQSGAEHLHETATTQRIIKLVRCRDQERTRRQSIHHNSGVVS